MQKRTLGALLAIGAVLVTTSRAPAATPAVQHYRGQVHVPGSYDHVAGFTPDLTGGPVGTSVTIDDWLPQGPYMTNLPSVGSSTIVATKGWKACETHPVGAGGGPVFSNWKPGPSGDPWEYVQRIYEYEGAVDFANPKLGYTCSGVHLHAETQLLLGSDGKFAQTSTGTYTYSHS